MLTDDLVRTLAMAADRLEQLAERTTGGRWAAGGLLATRPEVIAHFQDGSTEHVAEARTGTGLWIATMSPAIAPMLVRWLRSTAADPDMTITEADAALTLAHTVLADPAPPRPPESRSSE